MNIILVKFAAQLDFFIHLMKHILEFAVVALLFLESVSKTLHLSQFVLQILLERVFRAEVFLWELGWHTLTWRVVSVLGSTVAVESRALGEYNIMCFVALLHTNRAQPLIPCKSTSKTVIPVLDLMTLVCSHKRTMLFLLFPSKISKIYLQLNKFCLEILLDLWFALLVNN